MVRPRRWSISKRSYRAANRLLSLRSPATSPLSTTWHGTTFGFVELLRYRLALVCGGASDLTESEELLAQFGVTEDQLRLVRYRGYGNPGPTRIETEDGRAYEVSYQQMWEDELKWMIQPRCKICPDAIGEAADIVASDMWPGGGPTGEDEGF